MSNQNIEHLIEISKKDVEKHFTLDDGRIVFNGQVFKDQQQLQRYFKSSKQVLGLTNNIRKLFGFKPL